MSSVEFAWKANEMTKRCGELRLGVLALLALVGAACGSVPRTNYYTVDFTPTTSPASSLHGSQLGVALPRASHLLRQDRIVYFTHEHELNFYQYHRWGEPPVFMVQSLLIRQLRGAGLFDTVVPYRAQKTLDYVLRGRLLAMEEVDTPTEITARFRLELELVREEDAHVVWTGRHACERSVATKTVAAVVAAMSGCVQETLDELTLSLRAAGPQVKPETESGTSQ